MNLLYATINVLQALGQFDKICNTKWHIVKETNIFVHESRAENEIVSWNQNDE
ncbi:MAG: hypothetical protein WCJ40_16705 [Planctomycetota bacterium]